MYTQHQDHYHPGHFWLRAGVHPDFRGRGIGSGLFDFALHELEPFKPELLQVGVREDRDYSIAFLEHRGFKEAWRRLSFVLNLENFDATPFAGLIQKLEAQGFSFKTIDQLRNDPERDQKLCDLGNAVSNDVPLGLVNTPLSLEQFKKSILEISWAREEAFVVAIYNGQYVAVNNLGVDANGNSFVDVTGVLPDFRGRGLASALKLLGIQWAQKQGIKEMFTNNDAINIPMIAVNEKFGFAKRPSQIRYEKKLQGE
jgi:mycothiol synthase